MTAIAEPEATAGADRWTPSARAVPPRRPVPQYHVPAEAALAVLTLATVYGFCRLFDSGQFWGPLLIVTAYTHVSLLALRRRGVSILTSALVSGAGLLVTLLYTFFAWSTSAGVPTGATRTAIADAFRQSWETFQSAQPPVAVETGFLCAAAVALFFAVFLADWAAFRLWSSWEAVIPATTIFVFCSVLGSTQHAVDSAAAFSFAAVAFLLLHRIARRETSSGWLSSDARRGANTWLRVGAVAGIVAVVVGVYGAPIVPGYESTALVGRDAKTNGDRFTVSPLVEIKSRLEAQANEEMFTVQADRPAYWRLTALDVFDGNTWRSKGTFVEADGDLAPPLGEADRIALRQEYSITALARLWLPGAYQITGVGSEAHARYHDESGTLIVDTDYATSDGFDYTVQSQLPEFRPEELRQADGTKVPADLRSRYTELPAGWANRAPGIARQVVADADAQTDYDKARALQDYFQGNGFEYDPNAAQGHSGAAVDGFLDARRGYCEQYSGAFAAMARSLGLMARVAVGFTWGEEDAAQKGLYHVRGEHAHAWPEVYLGQYGWVPFEPTPGRGAPDAEAWTGRPPSQFVDALPGGSTTSTSRPTNGSVVSGGSTSTTRPRTNQGLETNPTTTTTTPPAASDTSSAVSVAKMAGGAIGVLILVGALYAIPALYLLSNRRLRRHRAARSQAYHVGASWGDIIDDVALVGAIPDPAETHAEFGLRICRLLPDAAPAIDALVRLLDEAAYSGHDLDAGAADRASAAAAAVRAAIDVAVPRRQQLLTQLNPANLFRRVRRRGAHSATSTHVANPAG